MHNDDDKDGVDINNDNSNIATYDIKHVINMSRFRFR